MRRFIGMVVYVIAIHLAHAAGYLLDSHGGAPALVFLLSGALVALCYNSGVEEGPDL